MSAALVTVYFCAQALFATGPEVNPLAADFGASVELAYLAGATFEDVQSVVLSAWPGR